MTPATKTEIAQRIRQEREALDWSREDLASRAGVSAKTIERIEAGQVLPRRATLSVIDGALALEQAA